MVKGNKIDGVAEITWFDYCSSGTCAIQTPFLILHINGIDYTWRPDELRVKHLRRGMKVNIKGFVRAENRLYRVTCTPISLEETR